MSRIVLIFKKLTEKFNLIAFNCSSTKKKNFLKEQNRVFLLNK